MKKMVIATDSFKGSLCSKEVEEAIAKGFRKIFPDLSISQIPMGDGGEGTLEALVGNRLFQKRRCKVHDARMRPVEADYGISSSRKEAYIEMAAASGLTLIEESLRDPRYTTSFGTGELIKEAIQNGCTQIVIGLGGSATNDGGAGLLQALGFSLIDAEGELLPDGISGGELGRIRQILPPKGAEELLHRIRFTAACDVRSPLTGPDGATYLFAPQKGANEAMLPLLEKGMIHLSELISQTCHREMGHRPGAGAAGGMGVSLMAFLHAEFVSGIEYLLKAVRFEEELEGADLLITGEGKADRQTLMGKLPYGILQIGIRHHLPTLLVAGGVEEEEALIREGFKAVLPILSSPCTLEEAMRPEVARKNITAAAERAARLPSM